MITQREDCFIRQLHAISHFADIIREVLRGADCVQRYRISCFQNDFVRVKNLFELTFFAKSGH